MRQSQIFFFLLLFSLNNLLGQDVKFGQVTTAELAETEDPVFGVVPAKVIYKRIMLNYAQDIEIHERIKIYNKEGFEHSNWEILYNDISHLQAYTYNLEDRLIEKTHVTKESIFKENVFGDYEITKITFPNVKAGSVIELKYKVNRGRMSVIPIQKSIPINQFRLVVQNVYMGLDFHQNPNFPLQLVKEETDSGNLVVYTGQDIPALDNAPYVNNIDNYRGKMYIKYKMEDEEKKWGKLTNTFNNAYWFGDQLKTKPFFKRELQRLIDEHKDSLTLAKEIYAFVKKRIEYNNRYALRTGNLKEVYKRKKGDKADINMLLTLMLRSAGFEANPMVIGCKHKGEVLFAEVRSFNATICALQIGDEFYLLDASDSYANFGHIPVDLMNGYGLILREDGSSISYPTQSTEHSVSRSIVNVEMDVATNTVRGTSKNQLTNYFAWEYREASEEEDREDIAEILESGYSQLNIENFSEKDLEENSKPVVISYDFTYEDAIEEINGELYVAPFLFFGKTENEFNEEERLYPIDVEFPYTVNYNISFTIPEGYRVVSLPEGKKVTLENGIGSLVYNSTASEIKIQVGLTVKLNYSLIPAEFYGGLRTLFAEYVEITKSKIVLSKI